MIDNQRLDDLFASARRAVADTSRLEYAFETRLLARLREERESSVFAWAWRLAPFFAAVAVAATLWTRYAPEPSASFAAIADEPDTVSYLAGGPQ